MATPERAAFLTLITCRNVVKIKMLVIFKGCKSGLCSKLREVINPSINRCLNLAVQPQMELFSVPLWNCVTLFKVKFLFIFCSSVEIIDFHWKCFYLWGKGWVYLFIFFLGGGGGGEGWQS